MNTSFLHQNEFISDSYRGVPTTDTELGMASTAGAVSGRGFVFGLQMSIIKNI